MKEVAAEIQKLGLPELLKLESGATLTLAGESVTLADLEIRRNPRGEHPHLSTHQLVSVEIDPTVEPIQLQEGLAREVIRKIQAARKTADFILDDRIALELHCLDAMRAAVEAFQSMVLRETLTAQFSWSEHPRGTHTEETDVDGQLLRIGITALPR